MVYDCNFLSGWDEFLTEAMGRRIYEELAIKIKIFKRQFL